MGSAWFYISFGSIPEKFIKVSMLITLLMFIGFTTALSGMFVALGFITSARFWPVLALIYGCAVVSCILYDTADGFKGRIR